MLYLFDKTYKTGRYFKSRDDLIGWLANVLGEHTIDDFEISNVIYKPCDVNAFVSDVHERMVLNAQQSSGEERMESQ